MTRTGYPVAFSKTGLCAYRYSRGYASKGENALGENATDVVVAQCKARLAYIKRRLSLVVEYVRSISIVPRVSTEKA